MVQRNLDAVAGRQFDLAVIGGGIVGAFCACDASRRGLRVLLVEAHDFGAAASEAMSHLVHGGLRYLAQGRLNLVREGLVERNRWRRFAPHRVAAQTFLVPVRKDSPLTEFTRRIGVGVYDLMGRGLDGAAPARWLNAEAAIDMEPALAAAPLAGACAYEDCRVDEPERAVLALIADAGLHGALALNHAACAGLEIKDGRVEALLIEDQLTGETFPTSARAILNAAGAAADSVASMLLPGQKSVRITRSKGVHFVTLPIVRRAALALGDTKRHAFVIPWKGFTLIGTSDVQIAESTASAGPSDLAELESRVRDLMPGLGALDVLDCYAGVRSLPGQAGSTYKAARDIAFVDHADEGAAGLFAIFGGKWTTARLMAERAVDAIVRQLGRSAAPCDTTRRPLACTPDSPADFARSWRARLPSWPEAEIAVWAGAYGRDFGRVLSPIADADGLDADAREAARFAYAVESEMAVTAEDVSRRLARWSSIARPGLEERAAAFLRVQK